MIRVLPPAAFAMISAIAILATGCDQKSSPAPAATTTTGARPATAAASPAPAAAPTTELTETVRQEAKEIFATRCTPCHGPNGAGDGPASAGLTPKPRNFQDAEWQRSVTDQHIETIIQYGGAAVGRSAAMPPNPDLADKPVVKGLRELIRNLEAK